MLKYEKEQVSSTLHAWSVVGQCSGAVAAGESRDSTLDLDSTSSTTSAIHSSPQCSAVQQRLTVWFMKTFSKIVCSYTSLTLNCLQCFLWQEDCCAVNVKWSVVMQIMHWLSRLKTARRISDTIYNSYNSHTHNLQSTVLFPNVNSMLESPTFSWKESCSEPLNTFSIPQTERFFWYSTSTLDLKRVLPQTTFSQWFKGCHMALIHPGLEVSTATGEGWAI